MTSVDSASSFDCRTPFALICGVGAIAIVSLLPAFAGADEQSRTERKNESAEGPQWQSLFDGKTLGKWKVIDEFDFGRHGRVCVRQGRIVLQMGQPATGIRWTGEFPKIDYEVTLEAMRVDGDDFFCGMTFPVGKSALTLVLGGWGGPVVGLSSIDGEPAVENETCQHIDFEQNRWYRIRVRVSRTKIETWLDKEKIIDLPTADRKFTIYWEMEPALPFGIATWRTTGALRDIRVRRIEARSADDQ